jgi:hypothetical protein
MAAMNLEREMARQLGTARELPVPASAPVAVPGQMGHLPAHHLDGELRERHVPALPPVMAVEHPQAVVGS